MLELRVACSPESVARPPLWTVSVMARSSPGARTPSFGVSATTVPWWESGSGSAWAAGAAAAAMTSAVPTAIRRASEGML